MIRVWLVLAAAACATPAAKPAVPPQPPPPVVVVPRPQQPPPRHEPSWVGIWPDPNTTRVLQVVRGAPADRAGIRLGDELVSIAGKPVASGAEIVAATRGLASGEGVVFVVRRAGSEVTITVTPEPRPSVMARTLDGKPAPDFELANAAGGPPVKLADLRGHVVIVEFWATWCGPCAITAPHLDALARAHAADGLHVIGISDEEAATVQAHLAAHPLGYTIALDRDDAANHDYLVQGYPTVIVVDQAGIVRATAFGVPDFAELEAKVTALLRP